MTADYQILVPTARAEHQSLSLLRYVIYLICSDKKGSASRGFQRICKSFIVGPDSDNVFYRHQGSNKPSYLFSHLSWNMYLSLICLTAAGSELTGVNIVSLISADSCVSVSHRALILHLFTTDVFFTALFENCEKESTKMSATRPPGFLETKKLSKKLSTNTVLWSL